MRKAENKVRLETAIVNIDSSLTYSQHFLLFSPSPHAHTHTHTSSHAPASSIYEPSKARTSLNFQALSLVGHWASSSGIQSAVEKSPSMHFFKLFIRLDHLA